MSEIILKIPVASLRELLRAAQVALDEHHQRPMNNNGGAAPGADTRHDEPWTHKQRRFVYRLAQQLGHEGEAAKNFIRLSLRLDPDQEPTRAEASTLIDRLKSEVGMNGNGAHRESA